MRIAFLLLFLWFGLEGSEVMTWDKLSKVFHQQDVQIRGFLSRHPDGSWILAPQPNLKTCCLGKVPQITVKGDFEEIQPGRVYTLEGNLVVAQSFELRNAHLIKP